MAESHREEIAKLEALYASNPGGRVFVHLAEALRKAGEYERARSILDEGLSRHGDSASGFVVLGRVLTDMRLHDEAERAFRRVLELDAANLVALRGLADLARDSGRYDDAARHYAELLARSPFDEEIRHLLADAERASREAAAPVEPPEPEIAGTDFQGAETADAEPVFETTPPEPEMEAPFSAAPGDTGESEPAEPEYGLIDLEVLPGDLAAFAGSTGMGPIMPEDETLGWTELERPDPDMDELFRIPEHAEVLDTRLEGGIDAEPIAFEEFDSSLELARSEADEPDLADVYERMDVGEPALDGLLDAVPGDTGYDPDWPAEAGTGMAGVATEPEDEPEAPAAEHALAGDTVETGAPSSTPDVPEAEPEPSWAGDVVEAEREPSPAELLTAELRTWVQGGQQQDRDSEPGLVTETMADLYMNQGHHERAAEVYRVLLERRPGDDRLLTKLKAAEHAGRAGQDAHAAAEEESGEAWLRGVGAWAGTGGADDAGATPYAWAGAADADTETGRGVPITSYLRSLLSWRGSAAAVGPGYEQEEGPTEAAAASEAADRWTEASADVSGAGQESWSADAPAVEAEFAEAEQEPAQAAPAGEDPWSQDAAAAGSADEPWATAEDVRAEQRNAEPWATGGDVRGGEPDAEPWATGEDVQAEQRNAEPWASGEDVQGGERSAEPWAGGAEPWAEEAAGAGTSSAGEAPADPWSTPALDEESGATAGMPEGAHDAESGGRADAPPASGPPAELLPRARHESPVEEAFQAWYGGAAGGGSDAAARPAEAGLQPGAAADAEAAVPEEDDEDLAMFREWLKSLKK